MALLVLFVLLLLFPAADLRLLSILNPNGCEPVSAGGALEGVAELLLPDEVDAEI